MLRSLSVVLILAFWPCPVTAAAPSHRLLADVRPDAKINSPLRLVRDSRYASHSIMLDARGHLMNTVPTSRAAKANIVYAVMTNGKSFGRTKLEAVMDTWAAPLIKENRFFAVSGMEQEAMLDISGAVNETMRGIVTSTPCADDYSGTACKEGRIMKTAFERGADWLVNVGDDNYVDTEALEAAITREPNTDHPVVLGILGCGQGLHYCPVVTARGGLCGGGGYMVNRAALRSLFDKGWKQLEMHYNEQARQAVPSDVASSCAMLPRGIELRQFHGLMGNRFLSIESHKAIMALKPLTYHYLSAGVMRWLHANLMGESQADIKQLEAQAFDHGCCCWWSEQGKQDCQKPNYKDPFPTLPSLLEGEVAAESRKAGSSVLDTLQQMLVRSINTADSHATE